MGCNSCQPSYIFKQKRRNHWLNVAFSVTCNGAWDFRGTAVVRLLCYSLVFTRRKTNLMAIFLQDSPV